MPRVTLTQTNFTAGEISPRLLGRVDIARYANGAESLVNFHPLAHGGIVPRPGTRFVAKAKFPDKPVRLLPYIFNRNQAYMLELGDKYLRVFKDGAPIVKDGAPYEIATPFSANILREINYAQGADTMILVHPIMYPRRLRRILHDEWLLEWIPFVTQPFAEIGFQAKTSLSVPNPTVGASRTVTSSASVFFSSDIGREIWAGSGIARIVAVQTEKAATVKIISAFSKTTLPPESWKITGSPQIKCKPSAKDPVGASITLTLSRNGWRSFDVGKHVKINRGLVRITALTSRNIAKGIILSELDATVAAPANAWSLESAVWNSTNGFPCAVTFIEQRLVFAGSKEYPNTIWFSRIGEYLNFELGIKDDDAISFSISSDQINPIIHLVQIRGLVALTYGAEFTIFGGVEKPITPTNIQVRAQSVHGASGVRPARIGNELFFMQRAGRKLRAMSYRFDSDSYSAPDLSVLSEHVTESTIAEMAYQQEPDSVLWMVRADGVMASLSIARDQDVIGCARHITRGTFESVATIPGASGDEVWVITKRTINGATLRYVERMDKDIFMDMAITGTHNGADEWRGLSHLEGETVEILADGSVMPPQVVTNGKVNLPRTAKRVQIGLGFHSTAKTLTPEVQLRTGSAQGSAMRISEVTLRFLNTVGAEVNGQTVAFRQFKKAALDHPAEPFTGDIRIEALGWERGKASITIKRTQPLPFHLLSVIKKFTVNG